jgi:hypothetical protein
VYQDLAVGAGWTDQVSVTTCEVGMDGPEIAFTFRPEQDLKVSITEDAWAAGLNIIEDTGSGVCDPRSCVASGWDSATLHVEGGRTYYVLLDSVGDGLDGRSGLPLSVDCCTPSCGEGSCGDDGCGGSCGVCASDQHCKNGRCMGS